MFKNWFKDNWRWLAKLGFSYLEKHLVSRIDAANPFFGGVFRKIMFMGERTVEVFTDADPDNKAQMKQLLDDNYVELISLTAAGAVTEIKDDIRRMEVVAILEDVCEQLRSEVARNQQMPEIAAVKSRPVKS